MSVLATLFPFPEDGYTRTFEAEIDDHSAREILVRGTLSDHRCRLEHSWVLRTPEYEVVQAVSRHIVGDLTFLDPELGRRYPEIKGVRIGRGFTATIRQVLASGSGLQDYVFLAIEMARVGQQVYKFSRDFELQFAAIEKSIPQGPGRKARVAWEKDRAYMPVLANSCHTYRDASRRLFAVQDVRCGFDPSLTSPTPGQKRVFWRKKRLEIGSDPDGNGRFACRCRMEDTIHDIGVEFQLDREGTIRDARSEALRVPYAGLCEEAQCRTSSLNGLQAGRDFQPLLAEHVGGSSGCTHLFDLAVDCMRLFRFPGSTP